MAEKNANTATVAVTTGATRVALFLTGVDGKLQGAIAGTLNGVPPHAHWEYRGPVAVTADMQDMFDKAIAFWISPYAKKGLEGLPNKR